LRVHASLPLYTIGSVLISLYPPNRDALLLALVIHGPAVWLTVLVHELSKASVAACLGVPVGDVVLWPYGGLSVVGATPNVRCDMLIAVAGPLSHIPLCFVVYAAIVTNGLDAPSETLEGANAFHAEWLYGMLWINVALAVFNAISPAFPFDSARLFCGAQVLTGAQPIDAASLLVLLAMPCVPALVIYGLYAIGANSDVAVLACALAVWILLQARLTVYSRALGVLGHHPLINYLPVRQTVPLPIEAAAAQPLVRSSSEERVRAASAVLIQRRWQRRLRGGGPVGDAPVSVT
jgi:hypothetical protein